MNYNQISAFCDGAYDCGYDDFSDEPEEHLCTCKHYLELAAPGTLCNPNGKFSCIHLQIVLRRRQLILLFNCDFMLILNLFRRIDMSRSK